MMTNKAILILADGMRPDALETCGNPYAMELYRASAHTMTARTVMPSVTLPCICPSFTVSHRSGTGSCRTRMCRRSDLSPVSARS